jgi:hypothetical protein
MMQKKACVIICYFGILPEWTDFWFQSAEKSGLDFLFITDADLSRFTLPKNIIHHNTSFSTLLNKFKEIADYNQDTSAINPYKLCDLRPLYGQAFSDQINHYSHWGFGDIDLVYGKVIGKYDKSLLDYDVVSFMSDRISGHLCLVRNDSAYKSAWQRIKNYSKLAFSPTHRALDEHQWSGIFLPRSMRQRTSHALHRMAGFNPKVYAHNHGVTPHSNQPWLSGNFDYPTSFEWNNGLLTSSDGHKLPYVHFMNWKSDRWRPKMYRKDIFPGFSIFENKNTDKFVITPSGIKSEEP